MDKEEYTSFKNKIEEHILKERSAIDRSFDIIVEYVEVNRRDSAARIFKDYYKILRQFFCMPSKDLQKFMENKVLVKLYLSTVLIKKHFLPPKIVFYD